MRFGRIVAYKQMGRDFSNFKIKKKKHFILSFIFNLKVLKCSKMRPLNLRRVHFYLWRTLCTKTNCKQTVFDLSSFLIPFCSDVQQWLNPTLISVPSYLIGCLNQLSDTCFSDNNKSIYVFRNNLLFGSQLYVDELYLNHPISFAVRLWTAMTP